MNGQQKNNEKGFTIIEVVLVLAIAALIFLMVFIALPALQRSQRDTQRKNDLARAQTALQNYQSNNRNRLPTNYDDFAANYLEVGGDTFTDPDGTDYEFRTGTVPSEFTSGRIIYTPSRVCDGEGIVNAGPSKVAFQYKLEGGGVSCVSN
ncbi:MAG TPA: type II secretion system protein [Candidatus Saccharimonadales bacterium]|nr:type II secretion system protein [Candidatus Saccharimonadales bacterium]